MVNIVYFLMVNFEVPCGKITILQHPNADRLELVKFQDYTCVSQKGIYSDGDIVLYIPVDSLLPLNIMEDLGLEDSRITRRKFRGIPSEGMIYKPEGIELIEGNDYSKQLNITKYVAPIPMEFNGKVEPHEGVIGYDIENIKKYPDVLKEGEEVVFTEKLHGTLCSIILEGDKTYVSSKGFCKKSMVFTKDVNNIYVRMVKKYNDDIEYIRSKVGDCIIFGEIFGGSVQDLHYDGEISLRVFDIYKNGSFFTLDKTKHYLQKTLQHVPIIWRGLWSKRELERTVGDTLIPNSACKREGIVIKPVAERYDDNIGRVILKSVSEQYLNRDNGTEHN